MNNINKEINSMLNLYLEIDNSVFVETDDMELKNLKTGVVDTESNFVHDFLYELIESNPEILKKHGFKEVNFQIHESNIQNI